MAPELEKKKKNTDQGGWLDLGLLSGQFRVSGGGKADS